MNCDQTYLHRLLVLRVINSSSDNGSMSETNQNLGAGFLKGFPGMQKKTTRGELFILLALAWILNVVQMGSLQSVEARSLTQNLLKLDDKS